MNGSTLYVRSTLYTEQWPFIYPLTFIEHLLCTSVNDKVLDLKKFHLNGDWHVNKSSKWSVNTVV